MNFTFANFWKQRRKISTQAITQATDELFNPSQEVTKPGAVSSAAVQPSLVIT